MKRIDDKEMYYEKKYKDMSIRELQAQIRFKVNQVNIDLYDKPELLDSYAVQQTISKLQGVGAVGKNGNIIGLGFYKNRSKESYIRQLRELDYAEPLLSDYDGAAALEDKYKRARDTFLSKKANKQRKMTEEDWRDMVETFGAISDEVLEKYGSNQVVDLFNEKTRSLDMVDLMEKVYAQSKSKSKKELKKALMLEIEKAIGGK